MKFSIVRHSNFGYGVVVKETSTVSAKVFFPQRDSIVNMVLEHHSIDRKPQISLKTFIETRLYDGLFDDVTANRAKPYINKDHIAVTVLTNKAVQGRVLGNESYNFEISMTADSCVSIKCSCPVNGACKHLYAVFAYLNNTVFKTTQKSSTNTKINSSGSEKSMKDCLADFAGKKFINFIDLQKFFDSVKKNKMFHQFVKGVYDYPLVNDFTRTLEKFVLPSFFLYGNYTENDIYEHIVETELRNYAVEAYTLSANYKQEEINLSRYNFMNLFIWDSISKSTIEPIFDYFEHYGSGSTLEVEVWKGYFQYVQLHGVKLKDIDKVLASSAYKRNLWMYIPDSQLLGLDNYLKLNILFPSPKLLQNEKIENIDVVFLLEAFARSSGNFEILISLIDKLFNKIPSKLYIELAESITVKIINSKYFTFDETKYMRNILKKLPDNKYILQLLTNNKNGMRDYE